MVGPTAGFNTTGTQGDDVIVAPLGNQGTVLGLGEQYEMICRVEDGIRPFVAHDPISSRRSTYAGPANDSVHNRRSRGVGQRRAGALAPTHYVGNHFP